MKKILSDNRHTMGWDAGLNRRLAVPLAVKGVVEQNHGPLRRILKSDEDQEDIEVLRKFVDARDQIDSMLRELDKQPEIIGSPEISNELDYINASIQLSLLEITGELEETPYSDELFDEAVA
jgi:hypothetical protein